MCAAAQMAAGDAPGTAPRSASPRQRVALVLALAGDLRYLSHHDELRMLVRALTRARWPVAYSQGFNPLPRVVIPLPRSLGTAADEQLVLVDLDEPRPPAELTASLAATLPHDCRVRAVFVPGPPRTPHASRVTFTTELDDHDLPRVRAAWGVLGDDGPLLVQRSRGPGRSAPTRDIRPFVEGAELEDRRLRLHLRIVGQQTARPGEVLEKLGLAAESYQHRWRRGEIEWNMQLAEPADGPACEERTYCGETDRNQEDIQTQDGPA